MSLPSIVIVSFESEESSSRICGSAVVVVLVVGDLWAFDLLKIILN